MEAFRENYIGKPILKSLLSQKIYFTLRKNEKQSNDIMALLEAGFNRKMTSFVFILEGKVAVQSNDAKHHYGPFTYFGVSALMLTEDEEGSGRDAEERPEDDPLNETQLENLKRIFDETPETSHPSENHAGEVIRGDPNSPKIIIEENVTVMVITRKAYITAHRVSVERKKLEEEEMENAKKREEKYIVIKNPPKRNNSRLERRNTGYGTFDVMVTRL